MSINIKEIGDISNTIVDIFSKYKSDEIKTQVAFDIQTSFKIIRKVSNILRNEPPVLIIDTKKEESDFVIVGDIHGNLESLISIFNERGYPPNTKYLFLGDYVDRGMNGCEVLIFLFALKCLYENSIFLIRGNHEFIDMTDRYGFKFECYKRVQVTINDKTYFAGKSFYKAITDIFKYFSICAILDDSIFCVHGGISALIKNRQELLNINKVGDQFCFADYVQAEFLWNDPDNSILQYDKSKRGIGCTFGKNAVSDFLAAMDFKLIIRGHQNEMEGFNWPFGNNGGVLTIFSAYDYCGSLNNGGIAVISKNEAGLVNAYNFKLSSNAIPPINVIEKNLTFMSIDDIIFDEHPCFDMLS